MLKISKELFVFICFNVLTLCLSIRFYVGLKEAQLLGGDAIYYIQMSDFLYGQGVTKISEFLPETRRRFPFYPILNYICYLIFGNSYLAIQIWRFFLIFVTNFFFYLLLREFLKANFPTSFFYLSISLYFSNFIAFAINSNNLMAESLLLGLTLISFFYTYKAINIGGILNYSICLLTYCATVLTKPEGIAIVGGILLFSLFKKNKLLTLISSLSFIPLGIYRLYTHKVLGFSGYEQATLFSTMNFSSSFYGVYRLIFCIPYEIFFSDAFRSYLNILEKSHGDIVNLPKYILSFSIFIIIIVGLYKISKNEYYSKNFKYVNYILLISIIGFLIHTPISKNEDRLLYYAPRLLIYLWPMFVIYFLYCYICSQKYIRNILTFLIILILLSNVGLLSKNFVANIQTLKENNWKFQEVPITTRKLACIDTFKNKIYEKNIIAYYYFKRYCNYKDNIEDADYILDFDSTNQIKGYSKIYFHTTNKGINFTIYKKVVNSKQ